MDHHLLKKLSTNFHKLACNCCIKSDIKTQELDHNLVRIPNFHLKKESLGQAK